MKQYNKFTDIDYAHAEIFYRILNDINRLICGFVLFGDGFLA